MEKIKRNAIRCNHCGEIIESRHTHDLRRVNAVVALLMVAWSIYDGEENLKITMIWPRSRKQRIVKAAIDTDFEGVKTYGGKITTY